MFFFVLSCNSHGNTPLERDVSNNDSESLDKIETEDFEKEDEIDLSKDMDFSFNQIDIAKYYKLYEKRVC